ncbi:MAG TPA: hypothetical protein VJ836_00735 [Candidatus Saccharimonadales bacterium]|nr:hypothetical protein [Candidatus Saccharimonadales bacterium]
MAKSLSNASKPATTDTEESDALEWAKKRFEASWQYSQTQHKRWERNWKLYNNQRTDESYIGISDTFVPMVYSTVETLTSALSSGRPSTEFMPQDIWQYIEVYAMTGTKPDLKALNSLYDYYWDCDNWDIKTIKSIRSGFNNGLMAEYIYWDIDKPRIINLPVRDLIIDPHLIDPMQLITTPEDYYGGRRFHSSKKALEAVEIVDPETQQTIKRYKDLDKVKPLSGSTGNDDTDKKNKEMLLGATRQDDPELVEVIEIYSGDRQVTIVNQTIVIEDRENIFKTQSRLLGDENPKGIIPIALGRFVVDESLIHGKSIIDPIAKPQELLNDMTNQSVDAVTDALNPQKELDPMYASWLPKITNAFGAVYPFKPGSLQPIRKDTIPANAFAERLNIKNEIREATGADQIVKGVTAEQDQTATEVKAQLNQAGQRFEIYVRMLERELLYQRAKIVYGMIRRFVTAPKSVPTVTPDGPKFYTFDPSQFGPDYEPSVKLEASVKNARQREQIQATQAYQLLIADPTNDLYQVKKILLPKIVDLSEEELDRIIGAQPPEGQTGMTPEVEPVAQEDMFTEPVMEPVV